jgi:hypothetical protein
MWLNFIPMGISLVTKIFGLTKKVEEDVGSGRGADKKAAVLAIIQWGIHLAKNHFGKRGETEADTNRLLSIISVVIDALVSTQHKTGVFPIHTIAKETNPPVGTLPKPRTNTAKKISRR